MFRSTVLLLCCFAYSVYSAQCGGSGIPFRFEVLPSGFPVLGCAAPQCFGAENGGRDILHDAQFNPGSEGEDGFFREGDMARVRSRYRDSPSQQAECASGFGSTSCSSSLSWVGGILAGEDGDLQLQCCRYDSLKFATEVGRPVVHAGEVYSGGEVIRDGRQTGFDLISNVKKIMDDDGSVAYELTVTRMNCLPDPPEMSNDVDITEADIVRILDKIEPTQQGAPTQDLQSLSSPSEYSSGPAESPAGYVGSDSYVQPQVPPQQQVQVVEQDKYVQLEEQPALNSVIEGEGTQLVGEQVVPVTAPGYYYPVASGIPACFTADTIVETPSGSKRMDELKIGDLVLTSELNSTVFTRVSSWLHRLPETSAAFIKITAGGNEIKLTPQHFIYKVDCERETFDSDLVYAEDITVGDCLYALDSTNKAFQQVRVSNVTVVRETGVYAPMTESGDLVASNIYASCHNVIKASTLSHTFLGFASAVHRQIRSIFGGEESGHLPPSTEFFLGIVDYIIPHTKF